MKNFAFVENGIVINTSIADESWDSTGWIEFSDDNPCAVGWSYDDKSKIFIAPQPFPSWTLNSNFDWQAPKPKPEGFYYWDEDQLDWLTFDPQS